MILSQGLLISLAFTLLVGILLFFYIKQRTNAVEQKINTLIQFIQNETEKAQELSSGNVPEMNVYQVDNPSNDVEPLPVETKMIDVSDDETDDESDSDSEYETDSDCSENSSLQDATELNQMQIIADTLPLNVAMLQSNMAMLQSNMTTNDINASNDNSSSVNVADNTIFNDTIKVVSLVPDAPDAHDAHQPSSPRPITMTTDDNELDELDEITLSDSDTEQNVTASTLNLDVGIQLNYKKMLVSELRDLVKSKGLSEDSKKLKKQALVELLECDM